MFKLTPKKRVRFVRSQLAAVFALFGVFVLLFTSVFLYARVPRAYAATANNTVNFQARLENSTGSIAPDGDYNVEFKLYDALTSSGASQGACTGDSHCLWTETRTSSAKVRVSNGYLTVNLGSVTAFPNINWAQQLYLTMNIGGTGSPTWDGEMTPRLLLTATPYAFAANTLADVNGSGFKSTLSFQGATGRDQNIQIPYSSTTSSDAVCLRTLANCTGTGGGIAGAGTQFYLSLFDTSGGNHIGAADTSFGSASLYDDGTFLGIGTSTATGFVSIVSGASATTPSVVVKQASGQTGDLLELQDGSGNVNAAFNSTGNQLSLGRVASSGTVSQGKIVLGDGTTDNVSLTLQTGALTTATGPITVALPVPSSGTTATVCYQGDPACGFLTSGGISGSYIQNQTSQQASSNFNISNTGIAGVSFLSPVFDTPSGTTVLNIGTTNATGGINLNQTTTLATGKSFVFGTGAGAGNFDQSLSTGFFKTGSGAVSLNGATTITGTNTLTVNSGLTTLGGGLAVTGGDADFTGSVAAKRGLDYSTTGSHDDVNLGDTSLVRLTGSSAQTITGIANGRDGYILTLVNAAGNPATLKNGSTSSLAANRITTGTGADLVLQSGASITLVYDSSASLWRVTGGAGGVNAIGAVSATPTANGGSITGSTLNLSVADATNAGLVSTAAQTIGGAKTFNALITGNAGLNVSGGAVTLQGNAASSITTTAGDLTLDAAAGVNVGNTTATSVTIGHSGIRTTIQGDLAVTLNATTATGLVCQNTSTGVLSVCDSSYAAPTAANFIQNQNSTTQTGTFNINGTGTVATIQIATTGSLDTATAGVLNIGLTTGGNATSINLNQSTTLAAGKNFTFASGAGNFDQSASSGTFKTGTGAVSLNGDTTVAANKSVTFAAGAGNFDQHNSTGTFQTGTGAVTLNGDTTIAGTHTLTVGTGATTLGGTLGVTGLSTLTGGISIGAAGSISYAASSTGSFDQSTSSGTFKTGTGAVSLNGSTTLAAGKNFTFASGAGNFDQHNSTGTFQTGTGAVTLNGITTISGSNTFTVGTGLTTLGGGLAVTGSTDFTNSIATKKGTDFTTTGPSDDVNFGNVSLVRLTGASTQTIRGIANGRDGYILTIVNAGANAATLSNNNTNSAAANRIITGTGADVSLPTGASITLVYDAGASFWRVTGSAATTLAPGVNTVGTFNGGTANSNGATITGTTIYLQSASGTNPGLVDTAAQTFAGAKTFSALITGNAGLNVTAATGAVGATIQGAASQNIVNLLNSSGTTVDSFSSTGTLTVNGTSGQTMANFLTTTNLATDSVNIGFNNRGTVGYNGATGNIAIASGSGKGFEVSVNGGTLAIGVTSANAITIYGDETHAAGKSITFASGAGNFDQSQSTGTFATSTGTNTLNGNTTVASGKTFTVTSGATSLTGASAGSGTALTVASGAATNVGAVVQGAASQSADLLQTKDANSNNLVTISATGLLTVNNNNLNFTNVVAPTGAITATPGAAGNLTGTYWWVVTYVTASGQTEWNARSTGTVTAGQQVNLSTIPTSPSSLVTARKIYRTLTGASSGGPFYLLTTIADNTTTTYTDNTADGSLGAGVGSSNTTGGIISLNGSNLLSANAENTAAGINSLQSVAGGGFNTAFGYNTLRTTTTGGSNVAFGQGALQANTTGNSNNAFGAFTLLANTTGIRNLGIGSQAGAANTTGSNNIYVGYGAGAATGTNSSQNVYIGTQAGGSASGSNSVFIGYQAGQNEAASNKLYIANSNTASPLIGGDFSASTLNLNGDTTIAGTHTLSVGGTLGVTGLTTLSGGLTATGAINLNTTGTGNTAIGNSTGTFSLASSGLNISTGGALTGVTGITTTGAYTQSGSGANTFSGASSFTAAGTGLSVTNNATVGGTLGVTGLTTLSGGLNVSATSGVAGVITGASGQDILQLNGNGGSGGSGLRIDSGGNIISSHAAQFTNSTATGGAGVSSTYTNTNVSGTTATANGFSASLVGTTNGSGGTPNINNGLKLNNVTALTGNQFNGVYVGTGYDNILNYNGTSIINGVGILQSAALSGTYSNALTLSNAANVYGGTSATLSGAVQGGTFNNTGSSFAVNSTGNVKFALDATTGTTMVCQNASSNLSACDSTYLAPTAGNFIKNTTTQQSGANINILSSSGVALTVQGAASGDIADFKTNGGATNVSINSLGQLVTKSQVVTGTYPTSQISISQTLTNSNVSATTSTVTASGIALAGTANTNAGANILNGVNFTSVTPVSNNVFTGLNFGTGYDNILSYNGLQLISGAGKFQNNGFDSSVNYSNLQTVTNLTATGNLTATSINTTAGTNTTLGNGTGTFQLTSTGGLNVSTGGALTGVATINTTTVSGTALTFGNNSSAATIQSGTNQNLTVQANGTGTLALNTGGAGTVNVGTANSTAVAIGNTGATFTAESNATANLFNGNTAHTIAIGTGAAGANSNSVTLGSTSAGSTTLIQGGTGASAVAIQAGSGGTLSLGTANNNTIAVGTANVAGTITIGGTSQTGAITLGQSTDTNTINVGNGATASGKTQTINLGTNGVSGSTTNITIGSATGSTTTVKGDLKVTLNATTGTTMVCQNASSLLSACDPTYLAPTASNFILFAPTTAQADSSANSTIFINKTGATGNIFEAQRGGTDVATIGNDGALTLTGTGSTYAVAGTGTISVVSGSFTVTGSGTAFTTQLHVGDTITIGAEAHLVNQIASNTSLGVDAGSWSTTLNNQAFTYTHPVQRVVEGNNQAGIVIQQPASGAIGYPFRMTNAGGTGTIFSVDSGGLVRTSSSYQGTGLATGSSGASGTLTLSSGAATAGNSGNISIDSGTATATTGTIQIGTANASGVTIGRSGITTNVQGNTQVTLNGTTGTTMVCQNASSLLSACDPTYKAPTATNFILNQTGAQASSNFNISNTGIAGVSFLAPLFDTPTGTTVLNIGATSGGNATSIALNQDTTLAAGKSLIFAAGAGNFDQHNSTGTFQSGTGAVSLNGNTTVAAGKTLTAGGGNFIVDTSGNLTAGTYNTSTLNGTTLTFGNNSSAATVSSGTNQGLTVQANGTGTLNLNTSGAGTVNLGTANSTTVAIGNTSAGLTVESNGTANLFNGNSSHTIQIGTGAAGANSNAITIGSTSAGSTTSITGGTGASAVSVQAAAGGTISIGSSANNNIALGTGAVAGTVTIGGTGTTGTITLGQSTATNTISIGSAAGAGNTQTINIGTSATATSTTTVNIGSTIAGVTTLQSAGGVKVSTLGAVTANTVALCYDTTSKLLVSCDAGTGGRAFIQGGNTFGATATIGTNDNNSLNFETNNVTRATLDTSGNLNFAQASTIGTNSGNNDFTVLANGSGNLNLNTGASGTVNLGTSGTTSAFIGNTTAATVTTINGGTTATGVGAISIQAGTSGLVTVGTTGTNSVAIGNTTSTATTTINGGTGASAVGIQAGAGGTISIGTSANNIIALGTSSVAGTITIGGTGTTGTITLGKSTATNSINIGAAIGAGNTQTIGIGNSGTGTTALTVGSLSGTSSTIINGGANGANATVSLQTATSGVIAIGSASANTVNVGTGAFAHTIGIGTDSSTNQGITIGSVTAGSTTAINGGTGASAVGIQAGAGGTINVGTSANNVINLGTGTGAGAITIGGASQTGTITLGQSTATNTITIGSAIGAGNTQTINLGTSTTGTTTLNLGSTAAGVTTLQSAGGTVVSTTNVAAFQVQGSDTVLTANTLARTSGVAGNLVKIGNSTGLDTAVTVLQLDNSVGDVTTNLNSLSGGLYYNSDSAGVNIPGFRGIVNGSVHTICDDSGNCNGAGSSLQTAYNNSIAAPEIKLDTTRNGLTIQDANTSIGSTTNLFEVLSSNAASTLFSVQGNGRVGIGLSGAASQLLSIGGTTGNFTVNSSGNIVTAGTYNGNTFTSSALTFSAASAASIQAASGQDLVIDSGNTGTLKLGTDAKTGAVQIGRTGITTTNNGAETVTQLFTANGGITVGANQNVTLNSGNGVITQNFTNGVAGSASILNLTNSSTAATINGYTINPTGTNASGTNTIVGLNFGNASNSSSGATIANGIVFGTGYTNLLSNANVTLAAAGTLSLTNATAANTINITSSNTGLTSSQALIFANDTSGITADKLISLRAGTEKFYVDATGAVNTVGSITAGSAGQFNVNTSGVITVAGGQTADLTTAVTGANSAALSIKSGAASAGGTAGTVTIDTGAGGTVGTATVNFGTANAQKIQIGSTSGADTTLNLDTAASGTIGIGTGNVAGKVINIGSVGNTSAASTIRIGTTTGNAKQDVAIGQDAQGGLNAINNITTIEGGNGATGGIFLGNSAQDHAIQIGTGAGVETVKLGSTNGGSVTTINGGTTATGVGAISIQANTGGLITLGTASSNLVSIGSVNAAATTTINGGTGSSAVGIQAGSGGTISVGTTNNNVVAIGTAAVAGTITIGGTGTTGIITLGQSTNADNTIKIGNVIGASNTQTIGIGNSATGITNTTLGSLSSTSTTTINGGTNGSAVSIQSGTSGTIAIGSTSANNINVGTGAFAHTIAIGTDGTTNQGITLGSVTAGSTTAINGGTGSSAVGIQAGSGGTINIGTTNNNVVAIGTAAVAGTITIGGTSTAGTITLGQSGVTNSISIGSAIGAANTQTISIGGSAAGTTTTTIGSTTATSTTKLQGGAFSLNVTNTGVGINAGATPSNPFSVNTLTTTAGNTTYQTAISTGVNTNNGVLIQGVASQGSATKLFAIQDSAAANIFQVRGDDIIEIGSATHNGSIQFSGTSLSQGGVLKTMTAGTGGVSAGDVVVFANDGGNARVIDTATSNDSRVFGVASTTVSAGSTTPVTTYGFALVNYVGGPVAIGDILVTSGTAGSVKVDNFATKGILGYATTVGAGATGTVGVVINPVGGAGGSDGNSLIQAPVSNGPGASGANVISPVTSGVTGLTVNGTTTGTAAPAEIVNQTQNAVGLQINGSSTDTTSNLLDVNTTAATSGNLLNIAQTSSAFTGTGILVNLANGSGSFSGAGARFIDLKNNGSSKFSVDSAGNVAFTGTINTNTFTTSSLSFGSGTASTISINQAAASTAGGALTIQGGQSGTGAVNGGDLVLSGGTSGGSGVKGLVKLSTTAFSAVATQNFNGGAGTYSIDVNTAGIVDNFSTIPISAGSAGVTLTLPSPTQNVVGRVLYIPNVGATNAVTILGTTLNPGSTIALIWNGAAWSLAGADDILNQNANSQNANFRINGSGRADTGFQGPSLDVVSAGTLSLGDSVATTVNIASSSAASTAVNIGTNNVAHTIQIGNGGSSTAQTITIGSTNSTSSTTVQGGNGILLQTNLSTSGVVVKSSTNSTSAFQVQNSAGAAGILLNVDTSTGTGVITLGYAGNAATFTAGANLRFSGTARNTKQIILVPEFAGATLDGSGIGTMTAGICSGTSKRSINSANCGASEEHNYYQWTTTQSSSQAYDIYVRYQLPSDFSTDTTNTTFSAYGWRTTSGDTAKVSIFAAGDTTTPCANAVDVATTNTTWTTNSIGVSGCTFAANDTILIKVHMTATQNNSARMGEITFNYKSAF